MSSLIALNEYKQAKLHEQKYLKTYHSRIDLTSKSHKEKAMKYYELAANTGNEDAMFDLAIIYSQYGNLGYKKFDYRTIKPNNDYCTKAIYWAKKAADLNHKDAINVMCYYYFYGEKNDKARLVYLLKRYN